jgi:predicted phosphoadenosine phosphosulfate sulfurtransferase
MGKRFLGMTVLEAARQRISRVFDDFPKIYVSFSAGKDSGVMLDLVCQEARARGRRVGVLLVDLEGQYKLTIDYALETLDRWKDVVDPYWIALPLNLRNAVSQFEPQWMCWDPDREKDWIRRPPEIAITDEGYFPWFRRRMEFEEFVPLFGDWYSRGGDMSADPKLTACLVGIRTQESLNRWRSIARRDKNPYEGLPWTTWVTGTVYNAYPIYDWRTEDIWRYYGKFRVPYNRLYDRMHAAGLTIHQARICQPYGDDQRRGLWLFHVIEPETWTRVVARVNGANWGAAHANTTGNALGRIKVTKPDGITWEEFAYRLLESMPPATAERYRNKIAVFLRWYETKRGYEGGIIPDEGPIDKGHANWKRICKMLLKNDWHAKTLSFSVNNSTAYNRYRALMIKRRQEWNYELERTVR